MDRKLTDGLFLHTFEEIGQQYKNQGLLMNNMIVDNTAMQVRMLKLIVVGKQATTIRCDCHTEFVWKHR